MAFCCGNVSLKILVKKVVCCVQALACVAYEDQIQQQYCHPRNVLPFPFVYSQMYAVRTSTAQEAPPQFHRQSKRRARSGSTIPFSVLVHFKYPLCGPQNINHHTAQMV